MRHRELVIEKNKFIAEIGKHFFTKKDGYFDWQYIGELDSTYEDEVVIELYWNEMPPAVLKQVAYVMDWNRFMTGRYIVRKMVLKGGRHDNSKNSYQVCLEITLSTKEKYK